MSKIDIKKLLESAKENLKPKALQAVIIGIQGAGKSSLCGTLPGQILYLCTVGEDHGPISAAAATGSQILPFYLGKEAGKRDGEELSPDETYDQLLDALAQAPDLGIESVVIDSASEVEAIIRGTKKFKEFCMTDKGKHNTWEEPKATSVLFRPIVLAMKKLERAGIHSVITLLLEVKAKTEEGEPLEANVKLLSYPTAELLTQQVGSAMIIGPITKGEKTAHMIQFTGNVTKMTKDASGNVSRLLNFTPRLLGISPPPRYMRPDLKEAIRLLKGEEKNEK